MGADWNGFLRPRKPHFFQIILKDGEAMRQQKLWIPRRFMKDYGSEISKHVQVEDPSGRKWSLEWSKRDGEIWFKKGWQDFADYYSLKHGHFLVFQYEGKSHFSVVILDMTATEIDYPIFRTGENVEEIKKGEEDQHYEAPLDDSSPSLSRKRRESLPPRGRGRPKKGRTSLPLNPQNEGSNKSVEKHRENGTRKNTKVLRDAENAEDLSERCAATTSESNNKNCRVSKTQEFATLTSLNKPRDFKKVANLKSKNLSFEVIIRLAHVKRNCMAVPFQFARNHFKEKSGKVILQISEGKSWTVHYAKYNAHSFSRLVSGWTAFARENKLETGVKCVFTLINHDELILKVDIVRANTCSVKSKRSFQSANPNFRTAIQSTHVEKRLDVPFKFAKTHFKRKNSEIVLQREDGSTSTVECRIDSHRRLAYFRSRKWNAFARVNNLETGDVCVFELLKDEELSLRVVIVKHGSMRGVRADFLEGNLMDPKIESHFTSPDAEEIAAMRNLDGKSAGKQEMYKEKSCRRRPSFPQRHKVFEAADNYIALYPYFKATITFCNFKAGVTIPVKFMRQTNLGDKTELMFQLQVGEERWPVKYLRYPQYGASRLGLGWAVFAKRFLRVGDVCAFELVDTDSLILKVTIFSPDMFVEPVLR